MLNDPTIQTRPKVLAVDDRDNNLIALEAALQGLDLELVSVSSGQAALKEIERSEFAAILLDVQMPVLDGFETARRIRCHPSAQTTPIIFVTAIHQSDDFVKAAYELGAVDYLFKPIHAEVLRAKVSVFCDLYRKNQEVAYHAAKTRELALTKQLLHAREEFLAIASHELRTPLSPLNLNLQAFRDLLLADQFQQIPKEKAMRMLDTSIQQVGRLSRLVSALLDVSKIIEGRFSIEPQWMDLSELIREICDGFDNEVRRHQVSIALDLSGDLVGKWDRAKIEQVIVNLLTNAMKYGGGKPIQIRAFSRDDGIRLIVQDQGIGIAAEDQERIFARFERAVSTRHYGGLGLGLYISRQIVNLHGGRIEVESELGKGSAFIVTLPKEPAPSL